MCHYLREFGRASRLSPAHLHQNQTRTPFLPPPPLLLLLLLPDPQEQEWGVEFQSSTNRYPADKYKQSSSYEGFEQRRKYKVCMHEDECSMTSYLWSRVSAEKVLEAIFFNLSFGFPKLSLHDIDQSLLGEVFFQKTKRVYAASRVLAK